MGCCRPFCAGRRDRPPVFQVARLLSLGYWAPVNPAVFACGFLAALPVHLGRPAAGRSRALPPSTRLPSVAAVPGASGHRPAPRRLYPAFSRPCHCIWCARQPAVLGRSRRPPVFPASLLSLGHRGVGQPLSTCIQLSREPCQRRRCLFNIGAPGDPPIFQFCFLGSFAAKETPLGGPCGERGLPLGRVHERGGCKARIALHEAPFVGARTGSKTAGRCRRTAAGRRCCSGA